MVATLRGLLCFALFLGMPAPTSAGWLDSAVGAVKSAASSAGKKAKYMACSKAIDSEMGEVKELLGTAVKDECGGLKKKSKAVTKCCAKKGKEMQGKTVGGQKKLQMKICMKIAKVADIPAKVKEAVKKAKPQAQKDLKKNLPKLKVCEKEGEHLADKAVGAVTGGFELTGLAPAPSGTAVSRAAALACAGLVVSAAALGAVALRRRRGGAPTVEEEGGSSSIEAPLAGQE